jgi:hypothetical protein
MWYITEWKKSPSARSWTFAMATGDEECARDYCKTLTDAGTIARVRASEEVK